MTKKMTFLVPDMHCVNCAMRLEGLEDDLPGVRRVDASYQKGQMAVEFDETQLNIAQIIAAVEQLGYHATAPG